MLRRKSRLARTAWMISVMTLIVGAGAANRSDVVQAQRLATVEVTITSDGAKRQVRTAQATVGATLKDAGIEVGPQDVVTPDVDERPTRGMRVKVVRVNEVVESVTKAIAYDTTKSFSKSLPPGYVKETQAGVPGERTVRYSVRYQDGKPVSRRLLDAQVTRTPVNRAVCIGSRGRYTSRGEFRTRRVISMHATAYDPGPRSCGRYANGRTATGLQAGYGVVAVDPRVIPMGSHLYIEGYGYAVAADRGRAIKGNRIDIGFPTYREAMRFGRKHVTVHVLQQ